MQLYFIEDLSILKLGQPPADALRAVYDAHATACLCAGGRDLALQKYDLRPVARDLCAALLRLISPDFLSNFRGVGMLERAGLWWGGLT